MICKKNKCTGCFACYNICPKGAIEMLEDSHGFVYPHINSDKCIKCGLCKKVCPSVNYIEKKIPKKCYAMFSKDRQIRLNSTSGGVATVLSKYVLENKGVVYGASFTEQCNVRHVRVISLDELDCLQGSKYVHSYICDTFKNVKYDLKNGLLVLFIGTPCQIAGLKKYLIKDYENLILVDIICHGVPSQRYLKEEVNRINNSIDIDRVNFRDNNQYGFYIYKNGKKIYEVLKDKSPYCDAFMLGLSLRPNCQTCLYATKERVSDITIGDFWGLSSKSKFYIDREKGVSTVIICTEKGQKIISNCLDNFEYEERNYFESVNGNTQLRHPINNINGNKKFQSLYLENGFITSYLKSTVLIRIKRMLSNKKRKIKKLIINE